MSAVVLRCPHCGTTKAAPGECQACHEAEVRYYCTNHTPGQWLDAATCPQCGARFGEAPRPRPVPPPPPRAPVPPPAASPARKRTAPWLPGKAGGPWTGPTRPSPREGLEAPSPGSDADPRFRSWPDLLREAALRSRRMRTRTTPVPDAVPAVAALGGCFMRAVFLIVMMTVAFVMFSFLAGSFFLQGF